MNIDQLIKNKRHLRDEAIARRNAASDRFREVKAAAAGTETPEVTSAREAVKIGDAEVERIIVDIRELERMQAEEAEIARLSLEITPTDAAARSQATTTSRADGHPGPVGDEARDTWVREDGLPAAVARGQRVIDHPVAARFAEQRAGADQAVVAQHGSLGQMVRAMTTSSGSALVPTVWAADLIDRARNYAAVLQAGAQIVPMDAKTVQIGRLTADPTAAFRTEGSTITASDPTFDNVTLDAKTMSALVVGSLEWFQDAANVDQIVSDAIAKAIGLNLDLVGLYGSITSGAGSINLATPPNPRGVLGALNASAASSVLGAAANGTTQTSTSYWNEVLDTLYTPQDYNEQPSGLIWNSKAARQYAKAYDTTGQPLAVPADVAAVPRYVSNQIPSYTQGTMTSRATDLFVGDWTQLLIGQRLDITLQTLTERYAENGQIAIVAHWRGDIGVARPRAFSVYKAIQGAP